MILHIPNNAVVGFLGLSLALCASAGAQEKPAPPIQPPPASGEGAKPAPSTKDPIPGLDDLLGIPSKPSQPAGQEPAPGEGEPAAAPADPAAELDPLRQELERRLTAAEAEHQFREAMRQMGESADRIERAGDVGLTTQRLHDQIVRRLDVLIKRSQQSSSSSSSSESSDQRSSAQRQAQPSQPQGPNQAGAGENRGVVDPPPFEGARARGQLDMARAAWGSLPERVRGTLLQGSSDYFSTLYEAMTEAYYKRLAEEAKE